MNPSELLLTAKQIAERHVASGADLNDAITKVASEHNLSKPQIERLVEETNKATFLDLLEKKGEQEFPVATYEDVKTKLTPKIEKTASVTPKFKQFSRDTFGFKEALGTEHLPVIEKQAASNELSEDAKAYLEALIKVGHELWDNYQTFMGLEALGQKRYGVKYSEASDLVKVATLHNDNEILQLDSLNKTLEKQAAVFEIIFNKLEKVAAGGFMTGEMNPVAAALKAGGGPIKRSLHAAGALVNAGFHAGASGIGTAALGAAKFGLKGVAKAAPVVVPASLAFASKHLNAALTVGTEGPRALKGAIGVAKAHNYVGNVAPALLKNGMEKTALFEAPLAEAAMSVAKPIMTGLGLLNNAKRIMGPNSGMIGPGVKNLMKTGELNKEAGFMDGLQHALEFITPAAIFGAAAGPVGVLGGLTAAAAKKLGGGIALTMNKKEFDHSFDTIMKNNPELAENKKQVRGYFDVVARHAPSLAKDPLVAESVVKNMNAFGGVDYNTVRGLRETEALGKSGPSERGLSGLTAMFGRS